MFDIDFAQVPDIDKKISPQEIQALNGVFRDSTIQEQLKEIERHRKSRSK